MPKVDKRAPAPAAASQRDDNVNDDVIVISDSSDDESPSFAVGAGAGKGKAKAKAKPAARAGPKQAPAAAAKKPAAAPKKPAAKEPTKVYVMSFEWENIEGGGGDVLSVHRDLKAAKLAWHKALFTGDWADYYNEYFSGLFNESEFPDKDLDEALDELQACKPGAEDYFDVDNESIHDGSDDHVHTNDNDDSDKNEDDADDRDDDSEPKRKGKVVYSSFAEIDADCGSEKYTYSVTEHIMQ